MTDEVKALASDAKTVVADVKTDVAAVVAEPAKVEAAVVAKEVKAESWVTKHPNYTAAIAVVAACLAAYGILHIL